MLPVLVNTFCGRCVVFSDLNVVLIMIESIVRSIQMVLYDTISKWLLTAGAWYM